MNQSENQEKNSSDESKPDLIKSEAVNINNSSDTMTHSSSGNDNSNSASNNTGSNYGGNSSESTGIPHSVSFQQSVKSNDGSSNPHSKNKLHKSSNASLKTPRRASASSLNTSNNTSFLKPGNTPGNRTSILSNYSGIVQNLDIDTIKYVGNKSSLQLSDLNAVSSSDEDLLVMHSPTGSFRSQSSLNLPKDSSVQAKPVTLNNESMVKLIRNRVDNSPIKNTASPPKSPLPKLSNANFAHSPPPSPLKKRGHRLSASSMSSASSSQLHGKLEDIMKEVHDLKVNLGDEEVKPPNEQNNRASMSFTSTTSFNTGTHSFHTANSEEQSFTNAQFDDFHMSVTQNDDNESSGEETRELNVPLHTLDPTKHKEDQETLKATPPSILRQNSDGGKSKRTSGSSNKKSKASSGSGGGSASHKSRRKRDSRSKIKPFSYETLAKLLNATDGIIIGQEFATLDIPTEEKFLIERIVDSISRLTANMIINPARYDQSCARLERVLNVLEGFD